MTKKRRRPLTAGLTPDPTRERSFVFGTPPQPKPAAKLKKPSGSSAEETNTTPHTPTETVEAQPLKPNTPVSPPEVEVTVPVPQPTPEPVRTAQVNPTVPATPVPSPLQRGGRAPLTTRLRADIAEALKRASLERQLRGESPSAVQDILDEALIPWLQRHGYLK